MPAGTFPFTLTTLTTSNQTPMGPFTIRPTHNFEDLWTNPPEGSSVQIPFSGHFPHLAPVDHFAEVLVTDPDGRILRLKPATVTLAHESGWLLEGTVSIDAPLT